MKIFDELMALCDAGNPQGFYFVDQTNSQGTKVRIFGYRMVSYSEWLKPSALEARGITFDISDLNNPILLCRPMQKFFNLNENPFTQNVEFSEIKYFMDKEDGSLVSFYWDNAVCSKTKMSCESVQAKEALELLKLDDALFIEVESLVKQGYTLNFEYVSPSNRVVLFYPTAKLILLNARQNLSGDYLPYESLQNNEVLSGYLVKTKPFTSVEEVLNSKDIEGYVGVLKSGLWFKIKCYWYSALHKTKDNLLSPEKTLIAVANEAYDDLYSLSSTDEERQYLDKALQVYRDFMNESYLRIKEFHKENISISRKDFAIKGLESFGDEKYLFGILMSFYGKDMNDEKLLESLKDQFIKNVDKFADFH